MELFIGLLVIASAVAVFVGLVKRANAKAAAMMRPTATYSRPKPLTPSQRKALDLPAAAPVRRTAVDESPSRAMRSGWRLGTVEFTYEDSKGAITVRTVTVHSVTASHIKGECQDRHAERTFRLDRIIGDVIDTETGVIVRPKDLRAHLA